MHQGSILDPLLFLVYVSVVSSAVNCKLLLYADDSALIVPGKDVNEIELKLTKEFEYIINWLTDNKLLFIWIRLNLSCLATRKLRSVSFQLNVTFGGTILAAKSPIKYLGV